MLYSCKDLFKRIKAEAGKRLDNLPFDGNGPRVAIIKCGDDEPSNRYIRNKLKDFAEVGIDAHVFRSPSSDTTMDELLKSIAFLNCDKGYCGIIVQRPILVSDATTKEAASRVAEMIAPDKDIDGVVHGSGFMPPSVRGLDLLLHEWDYDPAGKTAVVIGRGDVGRPVAEYLLGRDATVTVCHSKTPDLTIINEVHRADIVVGAAGLKEPIYPSFREYGGVVIDYGITRYDDTGELHGDFEATSSHLVKYQTPVPGGMGLMVRAGLLLNIVDAMER